MKTKKITIGINLIEDLLIMAYEKGKHDLTRHSFEEWLSEVQEQLVKKEKKKT